MIISTIKDGFGNQLFMYACGYAVARNSKEKLMLDPSILATSDLRKYEIGHLNIQYDYLFYIPNKLPKVLKVLIRSFFRLQIQILSKTYHEKISYQFDSNVLKLKGSYRLSGYWQSEKYFYQYRKELLKMFTPNYTTTPSFNHLLKKIQDTESVSLHIRRGDFIALGFCLDKKYYQKAIQYIIEKIKSPTFFIFSDDIEYAKIMLRDLNITMEFINYEPINSTIEDFLLMKSCKHNIIANSTFSWWGAWANDNPNKVIVCPPREAPDFFYPNNWNIVR